MTTSTANPIAVEERVAEAISISRPGINLVGACRAGMVLSGLVIGACLLLPIGSGIMGSPLYLIYGECTRSLSWPSSTDLVFSFFAMGAVYLLPLILAGAAAARMCNSSRAAGVCALLTKAILILLGVGILWAMPVLVHDQFGYREPGALLSGLTLSATLLLGAVSLGRPARLTPFKSLLLGGACAIWFIFAAVTSCLGYGLVVAAAGSSLLVLCSAAEAACVYCRAAR